MFPPEKAIGASSENKERSEGWKWKEFRSENGTLYLTSDAKGLDYETMEIIFSDARAFIKEKPEKLHTGSEGTVYVLKSGSYLLKEQKSDGKEVMEEHEKWKQIIRNDLSFPEDVHLIEYLALVEPPYLPEDTWGRRRQLPVFEDYQTDVTVGAGDFTRKANICSYVIMPFIGGGVDLGKLERYNEEESSSDVKNTINKMIEKGVIASAGEVRVFAESVMKRIQSALDNASGNPDLRMRDFAYRNVVVDMEAEKPQFYVIDL